MGEIKNPFNFGTGNIDKDQWLKDIDNELEDFISKYGSATNKHRTALIRLAFLDLRSRIANGDMLGRTADGLYQFSSALNREDKHMQEAYQRALGFMGNLARRQINTPVTEPEKKKYSTAILNDRFIKYFNPSGSKESFTSLWNSFDDATRKSKLLEFLRGELNNGLNNYQDVEDYESMDNLKLRINDFLANSDITNLNRLGFTKNYLNALTSEEENEEKPKSELEQVQADIAAAQEAQQVAQGRLYLSYNANKGTTNFNLSVPAYDFNKALLNYLSSVFNDEQSRLTAAFNPSFNLNEAKAEQARKYIALQQQDLNNYFANFATSWKPNYESGKSNIDTMLNYLSRLFSTYNKGTNTDGTPITDYAYDWKKYFTLIGDNQFLINGSLNKNTGRYAYYVPGQGIIESNILDTSNPYIAQLLGYTIPSLKLGGKVEFLQSGGGFDYNAWAASQEKPKALVTSKPKQISTSKLENSEEMDAGDWATILGTTIADIGSMLSANAIGAGTAASAGLGVASTLGNSVNDFRHGNVGSGLANLGIGLTTDLVGLIPGFGAGAKGYKIGRTLTRFARPLMAAFTANNFKEAGEVLGKGVRNGFGSLTALDWTVLSAALTSMISRGKSTHTRLKNVEFMSKASQHSSPTDSKGNITKHIINEEGLIKARKELLDLKRFGYNTASRKYTGNVWRSIPEGGEIETPFYAKPFEWPKFGFGKAKKLKLVEEFEEFLKNNKKPEASPLGSGPEAPVVVPNENANGFYPMIKNGAKLKALRKGGIIKALWGDGTKDWFTPEALKEPELKATYTNPYIPDILYRGTAPWFKSRFSGEKVINLGEDASKRGDLLGANTGSNLDYAFARNMAYVRSGQKNKEADILGYFNSLPSPVDANNLEGLTAIYNGAIDELYSPFTSGNDTPDYLKTDATKHNLLFRLVYGSRAKTNKGDDNYDIGWNPEIIGTFGSASFARRPINYETKFEDDLKNNIAQAKDRVSKISHNGIEGYVYTDENGRIHPLSLDLLDIINGKTVKKDDPKKDDASIADEETERDNIFKTLYRNPIDPTLPIIGAKTAMGLIGNDNIYRNLLDEMPQAPLRDPIQRQLAIVGWQDRIKNGQNQIADIRNINRRLFGYDPQTNFATSLETERTGRDISDKAFAEDAGRQFETAQKLWNLKNEDTMYNIGVGDANRRSIADRARMMAQIRAAWRSGNNNILMGALSDTGNWLMKRYQREQDLTDKVKELSLGNLENYADWALRNNPTYRQLLAKKLAGTLTETDRAKMLEIKMSMQDKLADEYADKYYNLYHTSLFGGGSRELLLKDGGSLEKEKLKARGKDNDRYVSMIKDLRTTTYRRRRRR